MGTLVDEMEAGIGTHLMLLVKRAMMLEIEYGIRTHIRFEPVNGQGEPVGESIVDGVMQGGQGETN